VPLPVACQDSGMNSLPPRRHCSLCDTANGKPPIFDGKRCNQWSEQTRSDPDTRRQTRPRRQSPNPNQSTSGLRPSWGCLSLTPLGNRAAETIAKRTFSWLPLFWLNTVKPNEMNTLAHYHFRNTFGTVTARTNLFRKLYLHLSHLR
jgi:hypothetical protein